MPLRLGGQQISEWQAKLLRELTNRLVALINQVAALFGNLSVGKIATALMPACLSRYAHVSLAKPSGREVCAAYFCRAEHWRNRTSPSTWERQGPRNLSVIAVSLPADEA